MIDAKTYLGVLKRLPPFMRALLGNEALTSVNIELEEQHGLNVEQGDAMMAILRSVIAKETSPHHVLVRVKTELNLSDDRAKALAREMLGRVFLPMERYLGGMDRAIRDLGGNVEQYVQTAKQKFPEVYGLSPNVPQEQEEPNEALTPTVVSRLGAQYALDDESRYVVQENILQRVGTNANALVAMLKEAYAVRDNRTIVACLELLSRFGALELPLEQADLRAGFAEEFLKPLAHRQNIPFANVQQTLEAQKNDPATIGGFVSWLLKKALAENEAEAARIGNKIETMLSALGNTGLVGMTYFDVSKGGIRWTPLKMKADGSLEWKE